MNSISGLIRDSIPPPPAPEPPPLDPETVAPQLADALANSPTLADGTAVDGPTIGGPHSMDPAVLPSELLDALNQGNRPVGDTPQPIDLTDVPPDLQDALSGQNREPLDLNDIDLDDVDIDLGDIEIKLPPPEIPFVRGENDRHTIDPNDIDQDRYGSCSVLSTLHTIASQDPSVIQDMIRDNGDGTYTVTFQEEREILGVTIWVPVEVTVSGPFSAGGGANPGDTSAQGSEVWPAIIEKAYVQHFHPEFANDKTIWPGNRGVNPADVMQHILGADATTSSTGDISSTQMTELLANGDAVVAWTPGFEDDDGNWLPNVTDEQKELIEHYGIAGGHAYAVSEVIPAGTPYTDPHTGEQVTCDEDVIVLDNPWGSSDVVMPYSDYQKVYGSVSNTPID